MPIYNPAGRSSSGHQYAAGSHALATGHSEPRDNVYELDEDINPDSDASLLRKHFAQVDHSDDSSPSTLPAVLGLLQRFVSFMSRTPLLLRSSPALGTGSYGALPVHDLHLSSTDISEVEEDDVDDVRRRKRRKRKGRSLRQVRTDTSSHSRWSPERGTGRLSAGRALLRGSRRNTDPTITTPLSFAAENGGGVFAGVVPQAGNTKPSEQSTEDEDNQDGSEGDGWSVEDPPDNSPLVYPNTTSIRTLSRRCKSCLQQ